MALLFISRPLLPVDHMGLRKHMGEVNRLGDLSIKWHQLGKAGVTLVERGLYQRAVEKQAGKLAAVDTVALAEEFNKSILPGMPGGSERLVAPVLDVEFFGKGRFRSIAYVLGSEALVAEWQRVTAELDRRNGVTSDWGEFRAHATVATVPVENAEDNVLDAFWDFAPDNMTLQKPVAQAL